mmetsp:Transcript_45426/g.110045  ORF Transcript_45426/g.110045 Transcript_45426/m.110045 type:complete len:239 (+) Transcript_45426:2005-2721(+)
MNPKALLSFLLITHPSAILGFTNNLNSRSTTSLFAKKQQNRKSKAATPKSGGGFASAPAKPTTDGKVRTVSGFQGSGTKPLRIAANTFDKLRKDYGKDYTSDVYCKSPLNDPELLWYVGKVNIRPNTAATPEQAVIAQKRLILEYAKRELRPQNLGGKYASSLELWFARGDSEMDAVQNKVSLTKVDGSVADLSEDFSVNDVGYNPEIYVGDEVEKGGLRIKRDDDGNPIKAVFEINA